MLNEITLQYIEHRLAKVIDLISPLLLHLNILVKN